MVISSQIVCRYLLRTSPGHLASARALELQQAILFKREISAAEKNTGELPVDKAVPLQPAAQSPIAPSLSARARPEARIAAAQAAELAGQRRMAAKMALTKIDK